MRCGSCPMTIDDFMQSVGDKEEKPDGFIEKIKNALGNLGRMKARHQIGKEIQDLKKQIVEVGNRNARYKGREAFSSTMNATIDPRALAIFENASELVGINKPKDNIIKLLTQEDGVSSTQYQVKMVSIVGSGGMGKTTLAGQVYHELKGQFECHAFLSVSRNPDMMTIMRIILSEVSNQHYADTEVGSIQQLIIKIKDFLADKRYFVVVDDIWDENSWCVIKRALPTASSGSMIITTTRMKNVALSCHSSFGGHIYNINPLSIAHSRQLFYRRLFNSEENCPSYLKEVSEQILKKCDGLPLAIIAISGLLPNKKRTNHVWNQVKDSIGRALERNPTIEAMMKILSLSYHHLPPHLKTCLLYLSLFPEDYVIGKNDLIKRWIAEGFIRAEGGCTVHELGERCFNELINRSLIQPVKMTKPMLRQLIATRWIFERYCHGEGKFRKQFDRINCSLVQPLNRYKYDKVIRCQVHDTILDFIISKSVEENFVTLGCVPNLPVAAQSKVRRLSIQANKQGNSILPTGLVLSHTRSLYLFDYTEEIPCLDELRHLHVLDFGRCFKLENHHLANIGRLFLLRYMNLEGTRISELPKQIGHAQCLEMLDLRQTNVRELPATIVNLGKLVHLLTDAGVKFPDGIGRMQALEILKKVSVLKQTLTFMQELGKLQNLRELALSFHCDAAAGDINGVDEDCKKALISSLCTLGTNKNLCSLAIWHGGSFLEQGPLCPMPLSVQQLMIYVSVLPQVPQWVGSLVNLHQLCLRVETIAEDDLRILGGLQALLILDLVLMSKTTNRRLIISGEVGFPCLKLFCIDHVDVMFARGAMPRLERLEIRFNAYRSGSVVTGGAFYLGINNLPCLIAVICQVIGYSQAIEAAMKRAVSMHPNRPVLHFEPFFRSLSKHGFLQLISSSRMIHGCTRAMSSMHVSSSS